MAITCQQPTAGRNAKARSTRWRAAVPLLFMAAGVASLVYGFAFHTVTVLPKPDEAKAGQADEGDPSAVPPEVLPEEEPIFSPDVLFGDAPADAVPLDTPPAAADTRDTPAPEPETFSESRVVREVTIGGLERLPSGEIGRTYRPDERVPTHCPT